MAANALPANQGGMRQHHTSDEDSNDEVSLIEQPDEANLSGDFRFVESKHPVQVLTGLNGLRESKSFCDVTLCVDGEEFPCHKIVLASFSPYFKAMFAGDMAESRQEKVSINGMEPVMMQLLIEYAYTSEILITKTNVQSLLSGANLLEVLPVRDACCCYMERNMEETNCIGIHCFAEAHACVTLQHRAKLFILKFFSDVVQHEEFVTLTQSKLIEFISDDGLVVDTEEIVFNAVIDWLHHDEEIRTQDFNKVSAFISSVQRQRHGPYRYVLKNPKKRHEI